MSKVKENKVEDMPLGIILPENYAAEDAASYFTQDAQTVFSRLSVIFRGGLSTGDPQTAALILAAKNALIALQEDITIAQDYLNQIITTKKVD